MTYTDAYATYIEDWKTRQALMDKLDEDGFHPTGCQWEDILKAMRDRQEKEIEQ